MATSRRSETARGGTAQSTGEDSAPKHVCAADEIVPAGLREYLRWDSRHDVMAALIMREFSLTLPRDRELIRQLAFARVAQGPVGI